MLEIDQDNLRTKFLELNADFISLIRDPLSLRRPAHVGVKKGYLSKKSGYLLSVRLSSVKMAADRHRYDAYHNKQWRQAS